MISSDLLTQWTIQLAQGQDLDPQPTAQEEKRIVAQLRGDIASIQAQGGIVELPHELA